MSSIGKILKKLDINPSTEDSFKERTLTGALSMLSCLLFNIVSVITIGLMATLFWGEFKQYMNYVDDIFIFYCIRRE